MSHATHSRSGIAPQARPGALASHPPAGTGHPTARALTRARRVFADVSKVADDELRAAALVLERHGVLWEYHRARLVLDALERRS